ncbi:MAG TPA: hypothetical protein VL285_04530 [Bryobacteraceae bacterium]|jgi:hypothetical protein|nr:hypothetical protein [Bryobacteraceae bacterium]
MRYWAFFIGKLLVIAALSVGLFSALQRFWPAQQQFAYVYPPRFGHDLGFTLGIGLWFLLSCGMVYGAIWDQRYRCRVCLRRLRMPVETGSWSRMLQLGRPEIEYICTYGHGRLNVAEVQISGAENPEWTPRPHDFFSELAGAGKPRGNEDSSDV